MKDSSWAELIVIIIALGLCAILARFSRDECGSKNEGQIIFPGDTSGPAHICEHGQWREVKMQDLVGR